MSELDPALAELAQAHGVATSYADHLDRPREVARASVVAVLAALGVPAGDSGAVDAALTAVRERPWRRPLPPTVPARLGQVRTLELHLPVGVEPGCTVELEDGGSRTLAVGAVAGGREVDGTTVLAHALELPADLPSGWHRLVPAAGEPSVLLVAPTVVPLPPGLDRAWGWAVQLYAVHSAGSWGLGDYADLTELVRWSGEQGAGLLLANPLHAVTPVAPVQPSPYYPTSRRFRSPLYLRLEATDAYAAADDATRAAVDALHPGGPREPLDRDAVWAAKAQGLRLLWEHGRDAPGRAEALAGFRREQGEGLELFARFCALAEAHGPVFRDWPVALREPSTPEVAAEAARLADRVDFHAWLQQLCDAQLAAAADAARAAGMPVGVVHDLAVGVDPGGADAWALQDTLALGATVGAPPDGFNPLGQDWQLPPWQPQRLAESGYAPYVDMLRGVLRHSGGVRIDHVMGLFRLWWVPAGRPSSDGTYVSYDAEVLLSVLALEAERAGVLVVGEDLGTVSPEVGATLTERGVLGTSVLFFETEATSEGAEPEFAPLAGWRELTMATVTTHDLPTAVSWLRDDHVGLRDSLGVLGAEPDDERARTRAERAALARRLRADAVPGADALPTDGSTPADLDAAVRALHAALVRTPARVVLAALGDAVGDPRQPNVPGTLDEYPNWRLPVSDREGRPVPLEELTADPEVLALGALLDEVRAPRDRGAPGPVG